MDQNPNEYDTYGAVYLDSSTADFDNCTFYENGLAFARLTDYTCKAEGGAIHSYNSNVTISDSDFEANYAVSRGHATARATSRSAANGGAIYAVKGRMSISGTRFHENEASSYASTSQPDEILGGAIYAVNLDRFTVTGCEFRHNAAEWAGGAVDGPRGYGGAIYVNYWETFPFNGPGGTLLADNHFYWNKTDFTGGAVFVGEEAQVKIKRCEFECNTLEQAAGPWRDAGGNEFIEDCGPPCRGDLNGDGVVDKFDLFVIYSLWGKVKSYKQYAADLNYDGVVNASDILAWTRLATDCPPENDEPFGQ